LDFNLILARRNKTTVKGNQRRAVAYPRGKVVCLEGDGSGMYALREASRRHDAVYSRTGVTRSCSASSPMGAWNPGRRALDMLDLGHPDLDWVGLARSMGVPGARITTMEGFNHRFAEGIATPGPFLVEVVL
jgi:acetolactate synthase-1/2/3 large subunit